MTREEVGEQLSKITTLWTVLREAHDGAHAAEAREVLIRRYRGAVYRYLLRSTADPTLADDLTQEFALGLLQGSLRHADPGRGRFRDYVRSALFHLVCGHRERARRQPQPLAGDNPAWEGLAAPDEDFDRQFDQGWRDELLARSWAALKETRPDWHLVLRLRVEHPELDSKAMAERLGPPLGQPLTPAGLRQTLKRARALFADLLLREVGESLEAPTAESVEDELRSLDLLAYCRPALDRRAGDPP